MYAGLKEHMDSLYSAIPTGRNSVVRVRWRRRRGAPGPAWARGAPAHARLHAKVPHACATCNHDVCVCVCAQVSLLIDWRARVEERLGDVVDVRRAPGGAAAEVAPGAGAPLAAVAALFYLNSQNIMFVYNHYNDTQKAMVRAQPRGPERRACACGGGGVHMRASSR